MAKGELFSTALRGFHKEQVNRYLVEMARRHEREKEELVRKYAGLDPEEAARLRAENELLQRQLEQAKEQISHLEKIQASSGGDEPDREQLRVLAGQLKAKMEEAHRMEESARRESERILAAARREEQIIRGRGATMGETGTALMQLKEKLDRETAEIRAKKAQLEKALTAAKAECQKMKDDGQRRHDQLVEEGEAKAKEILSKAERQAKALLEEAKAQKDGQMAQLQKELGQVREDIQSMSRKTMGLSRKLADFEDELSKARG